MERFGRCGDLALVESWMLGVERYSGDLPAGIL